MQYVYPRCKKGKLYMILMVWHSSESPSSPPQYTLLRNPPQQNENLGITQKFMQINYPYTVDTKHELQ
jgi:hypothetical protein